MIFTMAANDGLELIVESAFENVEQGLNRSFYFSFSCDILHNFRNYLSNKECCSYIGALQSGYCGLLHGLCELPDWICQQ